jgi:hypothetical protein
MGGGEWVGLSELSYICNAFPTLFKRGQLKTGIDFWGILGKVGVRSEVLCCMYESIVGTMYIVKRTYVPYSCSIQN